MSVIWITGLSGAGKSSLANCVIEKINDYFINIIHLDGDIIRNIIGDLPGFNNIDRYSRENRLKIALTYSKLAKELSDQGSLVIVSTISMFEEVYRWNSSNMDVYVEVYIDVPLDILMERDPKGIYKDSITNNLSNVAGIDFEVDLPFNPSIHFGVDSNQSVDDMADIVITHLKEKGIYHEN